MTSQVCASVEKILLIHRGERGRQVYTEVRGDVALWRIARAEHSHDPARSPNDAIIPWDSLTDFQRDQYRNRAVITLRALGEPS